MEEYRYTVHVEPAEEGGYLAQIPALNHAVTQGETFEEALEMARDLIRGYVELLIELGKPVPREAPVHSTVSVGVQIDMPVIV